MFGWREGNRGKKKDLIAALDEIAFQNALFSTFQITVRAAQSDASVGDELESQIQLYLRSIIDALVESEIKLYGYRGKPAEWSDAESAIREGKLTFPREYNLRLQAASLVHGYRRQLTELLINVESDIATPAQTIKGVASVFQEYREANSRFEEQTATEGIEQGLLSEKQREKIRLSAMKKIFKSIPKG
jgi:hypothetical protein